MKIFKRLLLIMILMIPCVASAAGTSSLSVSTAKTGVVGNQLKVTVTISSKQGLGAWQFDVNYPKEYLELSSVSNTDDCGNTTTCVGVFGNKPPQTVTYYFTFKVKKTGNISISSNGTVTLADDAETTTTPKGSTTVSLKTQAEIEASYSTNAYLKSLTVVGYDLTPIFNKETNTYDVEVENDVEKVTINASKEDGNASVSGTGEKELLEGPNKFDIVVTAQKGNSLTYTVNVNRKELNPIKVNVNGKELGIVRKKDLLPALAGYVESTVTYDGTEIPALYNEVINTYVIGLKDEEGKVYTYTFKDSSVGSRYIQLISGEKMIIPLSYEEELQGFELQEFILSDSLKLKGLKLGNTQYVINGKNVLTGEVSVYLIDSKTETFIPFNTELLSEYANKNKVFFLSTIILGAVVFLLIILLIIKKPSTKDKKKNKKEKVVEEDIDVEEIKIEEEPEEVVEEAKEEVVEETPEEVPRLSRRAQKKIRQEEKKRLEALEKEQKLKEEVIDELTEEKQKELEEEIKREEEALKERKRKFKEEKKEEPKKESKKKSVEDFVDEEVENEVVESDEVDDPLNDEDDFVDFWETMELKTQKKKD